VVNRRIIWERTAFEKPNDKSFVAHPPKMFGSCTKWAGKFQRHMLRLEGRT